MSAKTLLLNEVPFTSTGVRTWTYLLGAAIQPIILSEGSLGTSEPLPPLRAFTGLRNRKCCLVSAGKTPPSAVSHHCQVPRRRRTSKARSLARHIPGCLDKSRFCREMLNYLSGVSSRPSSCLLLCPSSATYIQPHLTLREEGSKKGNELKFRKLESELQA